MIYLFEGSRNSGKTFISDHVSNKFNIPKFKFDFAGYFKDMNMSSESSRETHFFALGKELMLMQISRDLGIEDFILDRGVITVFSWALLEKRISESEVISQISTIKEKRLLDGIIIIYIEGQNPNTSPRNKDSWDHIDFNSEEKKYTEFVIAEFEKRGHRILRFKNNFTQKDLENSESLFENMIR